MYCHPQIPAEVLANVDAMIAVQYGDRAGWALVEEHRFGALYGYGYIVIVETMDDYRIGNYDNGDEELSDETVASSFYEASESVERRHREVPVWKR